MMWEYLSYRTDLRMIPRMEKAGWKIKFSYQDLLNKRTSSEVVPLHPVSFTKGNKVVWETTNRREQYTQWTCADLVDGYYTNARVYPSLEEVLVHE